MTGLSWGELLVVGIVALIVVGPKDLPVMFRNVGRFVGKARGMAREFSRAMNDAADDTGVRDVAKTFKTATNPLNTAMDGVKDAAKAATNFDPDSETGKLSAERDAARKKIEASAARKSAERMEREAVAARKRAAELEAEMADTEALNAADAAAKAPKGDA